MLKSLLMPTALMLVGVLMVVFRRPLGRAGRFDTTNPPTLHGWGYWEKLIPNDRVAASLEEMFALLCGTLLFLMGLVGTVSVLMGR